MNDRHRRVERLKRKYDCISDRSIYFRRVLEGIRQSAKAMNNARSAVRRMLGQYGRKGD